ncbi:hypothetical protein CsSME_00008062 [Camellia sinensis var. sinensis]
MGKIIFSHHWRAKAAMMPSAFLQDNLLGLWGNTEPQIGSIQSLISLGNYVMWQKHIPGYKIRALTKIYAFEMAIGSKADMLPELEEQWRGEINGRL